MRCGAAARQEGSISLQKGCVTAAIATLDHAISLGTKLQRQLWNAQVLQSWSFRRHISSHSHSTQVRCTSIQSCVQVPYCGKTMARGVIRFLSFQVLLLVAAYFAPQVAAGLPRMLHADTSIPLDSADDPEWGSPAVVLGRDTHASALSEALETPGVHCKFSKNPSTGS